MVPEITKLEKKHDLSLGGTCITDKKCQEITGCMADILKEDLEMEIKNSHYISTRVDESTDDSVSLKLLMYIRLICNDGLVKNKFFALKNLNSAAAKRTLHYGRF